MTPHTPNAKRAVERCERLHTLGRIPPWWRPFARRRWIRSFDGIMALDISEMAELLRGHYSPDVVTSAAQRPHPALAFMRKMERDLVGPVALSVTGRPGMAYECPVHGRFVPSEPPRHYPNQPEAKCMAPLNGGLYCGRYCPPARESS